MKTVPSVRSTFLVGSLERFGNFPEVTQQVAPSPSFSHSSLSCRGVCGKSTFPDLSFFVCKEVCVYVCVCVVVVLNTFELVPLDLLQMGVTEGEVVL